MSTKPGDLSPKPWQEQLDPDFHVRHPRTGVEDIETLLDSSLPPEIFLTENEETTDIVIRFPATSQKLPDEVRTAYFTADFTLAKAFEEVLRRADKDDKRMTRGELTRVAYGALRSTWLHVLTTRYLHQFHPKTDDRLQEAIERLKYSSNRRKGRQKKSSSDRRNLEQKYQAMLMIATLFHNVATKVAGEPPQGNAAAIEEMKKKIWESTRKELAQKRYGPRAAELVFSGAAFNKMAVTTGGVSLTQPSGWRPDELALALLDEPLPYRMIKGKLTAQRSKKRAKS